MKRENSFHAFISHNSSNGNGAVYASAFHAKKNALEYLNTFFFTLNDAVVHVDGVTDCNVSEVFIIFELVRNH